MLVCWEDYLSGTDYDLACSTVNLSNLEVNNSLGFPTYVIAEGQGDQINVDTYKAENGNYMIVWEDSRNNSDENLQTHTDIYYQEINIQGEFIGNLIKFKHAISTFYIIKRKKTYQEQQSKHTCHHTC